MRVLIYSTKEATEFADFRSTLKGLVTKRHLETCRSLEELSGRLQRPLNDLRIALLDIASREDLLRLLNLRDLLLELRLILILPDRQRQTAAAAHLFSPRFLSFADGDRQVLRAVLGKMIRSSQPAPALPVH
jgi:hypothetical protein